jgi:hypothetical protein
VTHYRQLRQDFLYYLEEPMTRDPLIGSTISTISKKDSSCVTKTSSPSILTVNSEISKKSANPIYTIIHSFQKPEFERYKNDSKKRYEDNANILSLNEHQIPDHPRFFMKMIKESENALSASRPKSSCHLGLMYRMI